MSIYFKMLVFIFLIFVQPTYASKNPSCGYESLQSKHFEDIEKSLQGYVKKNLDIWMSDTNHEYDQKIPLSIWAGIQKDLVYIDLLFGINNGHLISSYRIPDFLSYVELGYREENGNCIVFMKYRDHERSGYIFLFHKSSFNQLIGSISLFEGNGLNLLSFPLN